MSMSDAALANQHDTVAVNHIDGWSLVRPGMSGEAFSSAMRDAATMPMGDALELGGLAYDICGKPLAESDDESTAALFITITRF